MLDLSLKGIGLLIWEKVYKKNRLEKYIKNVPFLFDFFIHLFIFLRSVQNQMENAVLIFFKSMIS
jgi:hypothetical protein